MAASTAAFTPSSIAGLVGWWKADAITGLSDGAAVTSWVDSSGNSRPLVPGTGISRTYKVAGANGLPVVSGVSNAAVFGATLPASAAKTVIAVGKRTSLSTNQRLWGAGGNGANANIFDNSGAWGYYPNQAGGVTAVGGSVDVLSVVTVVFTDLSHASAYVNSGSAAAFDPGDTYATATVIAVAGSDSSNGANFLIGDVAEVLVYNAALSDSNRVSVEAYLKTKWGTP